MQSKSSFISALFGTLVGGALVALVSMVLLSRHMAVAGKTPALKQPGMKIINEYHCPSGESKRIILNGKEDAYSPAGHEPAQVHERLLTYEYFAHYAKTAPNYDEDGMDTRFMDFMEVPANISGGIFVMGATTLTNDGNDGVNLGDLYDLDYTYGVIAKYRADVLLKDPTAAPGWHQKNDIIFGELKDILLISSTANPHETMTLLDYIQLAQKQKRKQENTTSILDIMIGDDVKVDFTALAVCELPSTNKGVTFSEYTGYKDKLPNIAYLSCRKNPTQKICNPFTGDTLCSTDLPVACFKDEGMDLPLEIEEVEKKQGKYLSNFWSGGRLAYSPAVRGDSFETIAQANAFCARQFGENWRVLSWHDGGLHDVTAYTKKRRPKQQSWIDIKDQPYGTCWGR